MSLERKDFAAFFAAVHRPPRTPDRPTPTLRLRTPSPFAWQERLLDALLEGAKWPNRLVAPTGAGKTAAMDVHVFAVALTATPDGPRPPRRLVMVVPRRVLVDDQFEHATHIADLLARPTEDILAEVAERLSLLRWPAGTPTFQADERPSPLVTGRLRGGAVPSRDWRDHPTACALLCTTPDMFGSRLLFRGYGTTHRAWPREAGLFAFDAAVVVDEAHLSRQLLTTARRVSRLVGVADEPLPVPGLQVVETTATPGSAEDDDTATTEAAGGVGVTEDDLSEPLLAARLTRPKPVRVLTLNGWPPTTSAQQRKVAASLADAVTELVQPPGDDPTLAHTVGCYVNTVAMAVMVSRELRERRRSDGAKLRVVTVCGQARPADIERLIELHEGVLGIAGNRDVDVLVATQSLEVGVDLDLAGVVTELAPGSALAQRVGRANRRGIRPNAAIRVVVGVAEITDRTRSGPYQGDDLRRAMEWVTVCAKDQRGMAPWVLREHLPPPAARRRTLLQRPEIADAWHWARTSDDLAARPELDLWLAESFDEETSVGIVVRDSMPTDVAEATNLLRLLAPRDREVFAAPYRTVLAVLTEMEQARVSGVPAIGDAEPQPPAMRIRGEDIAVLTARTTDGGRHRFDLRPGDLVVIDSSTKAFTPSTSGSGGFSPPVLIAPDDDGIWAVSRTTADDVSQIMPRPRSGYVSLRLEKKIWGRHGEMVERLLATFAEDLEDATERRRRDGLAALLMRLLADIGEDPRAPMVRAVKRLLGQSVKSSDLELYGRETGELRLLVIDRRRAGSDEQLRQTWSVNTDPVTLDGHQCAVATRAFLFGERLGLPEPLVRALRVAGAHHDDGKSDSRFQARLGARADGEVLAKSDPNLTVAESRRLAGRCGVPERWRHEQRSVVQSWDAVHAGMTREYAQLAARLVGTSHGHGRLAFPHTAAELLLPDDPVDLHHRAQDLFDLGAWEELIEQTHRRWGVWGCAYLEALLRAADGQISSEGR